MSFQNKETPADPPFSAYTSELLRRAGWFPERSIDISNYLRGLCEYGYQISPLVRDFLTRFGGIVIDYNINTKYGTMRLITHFNVINALIYPEEIEECINSIGLPVCVIGETDNQHITLLMDNRGRVHGCYEGNLFFFGDDGMQAIDNILTEERKRLGLQ